MKRKILPILILALCILTACGPASIQTTDPGGPPDDQYHVTSCVPIFESAPPDIKPKGTIVFLNYKSAAHFFLMNLETARQTPLDTLGQPAADITISPDRKNIAYKINDPVTNTFNLIISDAQANITKNIPWDKGFFVVKEWINNEEILLSSSPPIIVFNPNTNQQKGYEISDFPDYSDDPISGNRFILFDKTMETALYKNTNGKIALLDMDNKNVLGEVENVYAPYATAAWSPDGSQVAVVGSILLGEQRADVGYDIFTISRDGQVKQLTHLTDHYGKLLIISPAGGLKWSPDGKKIAFWLANPKNPEFNWQLAVYDTETQKTTNYCIPSSLSSNLTMFQQLAPPLWSPDSTQIMVENRYDTENNRVVILDIAKNAAFEVIDNMYPLGWVVPDAP